MRSMKGNRRRVRRQHDAGAVAILDVGRMDDDAQQQTVFGGGLPIRRTLRGCFNCKSCRRKPTLTGCRWTYGTC